MKMVFAPGPELVRSRLPLHFANGSKASIFVRKAFL